MPTITVEWLRANRACQSEIQVFIDTFGHCADVTAENLARADAVRLNLWWLANRVLTKTALAKFAHFREGQWCRYQQAAIPATRAYQNAVSAVDLMLTNKSAIEVAYKEWERVAGRAFIRYHQMTTDALIDLLMNTANWNAKHSGEFS